MLRQLNRLLHCAQGQRSGRFGYLRERRSEVDGVRSTDHVLIPETFSELWLRILRNGGILLRSHAGVFTLAGGVKIQSWFSSIKLEKVQRFAVMPQCGCRSGVSALEFAP